MACPHPGEERRGVYDGSAARRLDRDLCALCGEILYAEAQVPCPPAPLSGARPGETAGTPRIRG